MNQNYVKQAAQIKLRPFEEYMEHFKVSNINEIINFVNEIINNNIDYSLLSETEKQKITNNVILMSLRLIPLDTWINVVLTTNVFTGQRFTDPLDYLLELSKHISLSELISYITVLIVNSIDNPEVLMNIILPDLKKPA